MDTTEYAPRPDGLERVTQRRVGRARQQVGYWEQNGYTIDAYLGTNAYFGF